MSITIRLGSQILPVVADTTGELNDIVWSSLGPMRGTFSHYKEDLSGADDSNAIRWPRSRPIAIPFPGNLKLNELYWPTLIQHASELWVVIACGQSTADSVIGQLMPAGEMPFVEVTIGMGFQCKMITAGAWQIDQFKRPEIGGAGASPSPYQELIVVCFTDIRYLWRTRLEALTSAAQDDESYAEIVIPSAADLVQDIASDTEDDSTVNWGSLICQETWDHVTPCQMSVSLTKPPLGAWLDAVNIGMGAWPVFVPSNYGRAAFIPHNETYALWASDNETQYRERRFLSPVIRRSPTANINTMLQSSSFPGMLTSVMGMVRLDGIASGNKVLFYTGQQDRIASQSSENHLARAVARAETAFFLNSNATGQSTGVTGTDSAYRDWLKIQNTFRYFAGSFSATRFIASATRPWDRYVGSTPQYGSGSLDRFPPSAWIVRPFGNQLGDGVDINTTDIEEVSWSVEGLPREFPVTWKPASSEVDRVDSGKVGQSFKAYYNRNDQKWYRIPVGVSWPPSQLLSFNYRCEPVRYAFDGSMSYGSEWCESLGNDAWCSPEWMASELFEKGDWITTPCTALITRTSFNSQIAGDTRCWEMIWGAESVSRAGSGSGSGGPGGSGAIVYETDVQCQQGYLTVYRRTVYIIIENGVLRRQPVTGWVFSHYAGCCDCGSGTTEPPSCTGSCIWIYSSGRGWTLVEDNCVGEGDCGCDNPPFAEGLFPTELSESGCYTGTSPQPPAPPDPDPPSGDCVGDCVWVWNGFTNDWELAFYSCRPLNPAVPASCICSPPMRNGDFDGDHERVACSGFTL